MDEQKFLGNHQENFEQFIEGDRYISDEEWLEYNRQSYNKMIIAEQTNPDWCYV